MSDVVDRGRVCVVVDKYPKRENGQDVYENGAQVMKNKYMAIGECTKWRDNTGRENVTRKIMLNPPSLPCEQYEFWDSESKQQQSAAPAVVTSNMLITVMHQPVRP